MKSNQGIRIKIWNRKLLARFKSILPLFNNFDFSSFMTDNSFCLVPSVVDSDFLDDASSSPSLPPSDLSFSALFSASANTFSLKLFWDDSPLASSCSDTVEPDLEDASLILLLNSSIAFLFSHESAKLATVPMSSLQASFLTSTSCLTITTWQQMSISNV